MARKTVLGGSAISDLKEDRYADTDDSLLNRWFNPYVNRLVSEFLNPFVEITVPGKTMLVGRLFISLLETGTTNLSVPSTQLGEKLVSTSRTFAVCSFANGVTVNGASYLSAPYGAGFISQEVNNSTSLAFPCIRATGEANGADDATFTQDLCLIPYNNELLLYSWKSGYSIGSKFKAIFDVTLYKDN